MKNKINNKDNFKSFVGQKELLKTIDVLVKSAAIQKKQVEHILFVGQPGMGKTTLSKIVAKKLKTNTKFVQGSLIEKKSDILSIFSSISRGDVVFIDEFHSINKNIVELLHSIMEEKVIDIFIGPEGENKVMRMNIVDFTLIGATTKIEQISQPILNRFGFIATFKNYNQKEISQIILNHAFDLKCDLNQELSFYIAKYSQNIPRIAKNLLRRIFDFSLVFGNKINKHIINKTLHHLHIYPLGLTRSHINYLNVLFTTFKTKPASLDSIIGVLNENKENIIFNIEPLLLNNQLIQKTSRGRKISLKGIRYMESNISPNN